MRPLSSSDLLHIWERGSGRTLVEQALAILEVAFPQAPDGLFRKLNIGQRDLFLLHLRTLTFGPRIKGLIDCPACRQQLELDFNAYDLPIPNSPMPDLETLVPLDAEKSFRLKDYEVSFRLPNSTDLMTLTGATDGKTGPQQLLEACLMLAKHHDKTIDLMELPSEVLNGVVECMSKTDPLADLTFPATCPACGHTWEVIFDIVSFFWSEIYAWSARLVREVHTLALAYGWREADILAMSAWRRQQYLHLMSV